MIITWGPLQKRVAVALKNMVLKICEIFSQIYREILE